MKRLIIILFLMMLIGTASAASTLYLMPINASEPMPNAKQSADTIHLDVAGAYASYTNPGILSETMGSTPLTRESTAAEAGAVHYTHYGTWVTNPLAAQWVNGTVTVNLTMRESSSSANVMPRLKIYRWYANDTKGSELRTIGNSATEVGTSYPATPIRYFNAVALTSTLFEEGDRIAVELESYDNNAVTTSWLHGIRYGGTAGNSSHIVFSQTLAYAPTKETIVYSGQRPINDKLSIISDSAARSTTLAVEMHKVVGAITLPYKFTDGTTEITIKKIELNVPDAKVGYYINAIRDGQEVHTHSPVWVVNSPYEVTQSESTNTLLNEKTITVKEDPQSAAQQVLSGYVSRQPLGKAVGDDTLIVYPKEDGRISRTGNETFPTLNTGAGTAISLTDTTSQSSIAAGATTGYFTTDRWNALTFNTSSIGSGSTVTGATLSLWGISRDNTLYTWSAVITNSSHSDSMVVGDFNKYGSVVLSNNITYASFSTTVWNNFTFTPEGLSFISKNGFTKLTARMDAQVDNVCPWAASKPSSFYIATNDNTNASIRPALTITYTPADTTPPTSITGLTNNTTTCEQINWTWTNPSDADYNGTMIWKNGTWLKNTTSTTVFDLWTGLVGGVEYEFASRTFDNATSPNVNATFTNMTATPTSCLVAPVSSFTVNRPIARIPQVLTFTNTSTNIPTGWNWSWGDGTWTNGTTNNPTHQYKKRGIFPVFLLSSNAVGSNTSATQNIRVVGYENYW